MQTTITFRTDEELKKEASKLFESLGMNLSTALNVFMRQAVIKQRFPCSIDAPEIRDAENTYPSGFFAMFGTLKDGGIEEPEDLLPEEVEL